MSISAIQIYKEHSRLLDEQDTTDIYCRAGCDMCCNQLFGVTPDEWELISAFLPKNEMKRIAQEHRDLVIEWNRYVANNSGIDPALIIMGWMGKCPCIFLSHGVCRIYPVRPMSCRVLTSTSRCKDFNNPDCRRFRYHGEKQLHAKLFESTYAKVFLNWI